MICHIDKTKYPPDAETVFGASWSCFPPNGTHEVGTVAYWIVYAPHSHSFWPYVAISVCHLRPLPTGPAAKIFKFGATHEITVYALDPGSAPVPVFGAELKWLRPTNYVGQFIVQGSNPVKMDKLAAERAQAAVDAILRGELNPDTDGRRGWVALFGDECLQ